MQELVKLVEQLLTFGETHAPAGVQLELDADYREQPYLLAACRWQVDKAEWQRHLASWCDFLQQLKPEQSQQWREMFQEFSSMEINDLWNYHPGSSETAWVKNLIFLELLRQQKDLLQTEIKDKQAVEHCPVCGSPPLLAVLVGPGGSRQLVCGTCTARWDYPALACPNCSNREHETLYYRQIENLPGWRIEGCRKCNSTIKVLDLRSGKRDAHPWVLDAESIALNFIDQKEE